MKNGNLSINSENIFPVIKKWLYSDHDIFVRELISNGCDAVTKLKKLSLMGEFDEPDEPYRIDVTTSANDKTDSSGHRRGSHRRQIPVCRTPATPSHRQED